MAPLHDRANPSRCGSDQWAAAEGTRRSIHHVPPTPAHALSQKPASCRKRLSSPMLRAEDAGLLPPGRPAAHLWRNTLSSVLALLLPKTLRTYVRALFVLTMVLSV